MARFLVVKNFGRFQHYKDRNPPWIKFHYATLSDYEVTSLSDAAQGQLFKFWLLASRYDNQIPYDLKWLKREIKANGPLLLKELLASGLLEIREQDASAVLGLARSREVEGEKKQETETETTPSARGDVRTVLESEPVQRLLAKLPADRRPGYVARIGKWVRGEGLPNGVRPNGAEIIDAIDEYDGGDSPDLLLRFICRKAKTMREHATKPERASLADTAEANALAGALAIQRRAREAL